jgi:hypothetical protein
MSKRGLISKIFGNWKHDPLTARVQEAILDKFETWSPFSFAP